jgi:hypothetical protein
MVSNIFALLYNFGTLFITGFNNRTSAARTTDFLNTSGAPLDDAAGYPKLFRPRRRFCRIGATKIPWVGLNFRYRDSIGQNSNRPSTKMLVGVSEQ